MKNSNANKMNKSGNSIPVSSSISSSSSVNDHKIFVGGLAVGDNMEEILTNHYSQYGKVIGVEFPTVGFAFVTFKDPEVVSNLLSKKWEIVAGRQVEMKRYVPSTNSPFLLQKDEAVKAVLDIPNRVDKLLTVEEIKPKVLAVGKSHTWTVRVKNSSLSDSVISNILFLLHKPEFQIVDINSDSKKSVRKLPFILERGATFTFGVKFEPRHHFHGIYRAPLAVRFKDFFTLSEVVIKVTDPEALQKLQPRVEFKPVEIDEIQRKIIPAFPPSRGSSTHFHTPVETPYIIPIPEYPIPEKVQAPVDSGKTMSGTNFWKNKENHIARLHNLLYIEEAQQKKNLRKFDLREVTMDSVTEVSMGTKRVNPPEPCMRLYVPGLAEQRPSVLQGDAVYAWLPGTSDYEYEGMVWRVEERAVLLMFCLHFELIFPKDTKFNVRFSFNRMHMRYMHRAVDATDLNIIWPSPSVSPSIQIRDELSKSGKSLVSSPGLANAKLGSAADSGKIKKFLDNDITNNPNQARAVEAVTFRQNKHVPFLLFGSFGTGKTKTMVEMVRQVVKNTKNPHILICAKVNSAADIFVEKLSSFFTPAEMFRLFAFHRSLSAVNHIVQNYAKITHTSEKDLFDVPPLDELFKYTIVVTTTLTSATLYGIGMGPDHFTHIFIDEAAQTMEPEALIPLAMAKYGKTSVVMAGDDQQLGPKVYSPSCRHHGLSLSIMERLVTQSVYNNRSDSSLCVSLFNVYRSHPLISHIPSNLFYGGKLKSMVDPEKVTIKWSVSNFPVFFYGVEGQDAQEGDSPSFFNPEEAIALVTFVHSLLNEINIKEQDICIIAPYSKQVKVIRDILRSQYKLYYVNVGGVDEMQGREFKVVLLSTVRARETWHKWKQFDSQHHLGLVADSKRLNTAITRAQSLLVFVGDPYVLYRDPNFQYIINYCIDNGSYQNIPLKNVQEWKEPSSALSNLSIAPSPSASAAARPNAWSNPLSLSSSSSSSSPSPSPSHSSSSSTPVSNLTSSLSSISTPPKPTIPVASKKSKKSAATNDNKNDNKNDNTKVEDDNATNQDKENYLEAATRVINQHVREPSSSRAAAVAVPSQDTVNVQRKDALLKVLDHFFDPTYHGNLSGRDPNVLAPLFAQAYTPLVAATTQTKTNEKTQEEKIQAQGEIMVVSQALIRKIVDAGTQVGCDESIHAVAVLRILSEHAANASQLLIQIIPEQLAKLKSDPTTKTSQYTGVFLAHVFQSKLIIHTPSHNLLVHLIPESNNKQNIFLAEVLASMTEVLGQEEVVKIIENLKWDMGRIFNKQPLQLAKFMKEKKIQFLTPDLPEPQTIIPQTQPQIINNIDNKEFQTSALNASSPPFKPLGWGLTPVSPDPTPFSSSSISSIPSSIPPSIPDSSLGQAIPATMKPNPSLIADPSLLPQGMTQNSFYSSSPFSHLNNFNNNSLYSNQNLGFSNFNFPQQPSMLGFQNYPFHPNFSPYLNYPFGNLSANGTFLPNSHPQMQRSNENIAIPNLNDLNINNVNNINNIHNINNINHSINGNNQNNISNISNIDDDEPFIESRTPSSEKGLDILYEIDGNQFLVTKTGSSVPPLSVFIENSNIKVEICVYNLDVNITQNGSLVYVDLTTKTRVKQAHFVLPTLRSTSENQKLAKRGATKLVIGIPPEFSQTVESKQGEYMLLIILKPRPLPTTIERIIPTIINDAI